MSTEQIRDLDQLRPLFRERLDAWLAAARTAFPDFDLVVHETLRTQERQDWGNDD